LVDGGTAANLPIGETVAPLASYHPLTPPNNPRITPQRPRTPTQPHPNPNPNPPSQCTGVLPFTGGDALIYGEAISSEGGLDRVRPLMGVCPQFDVLWPELTGAEHLMIYGHVKGVEFSKVRGGVGG